MMNAKLYKFVKLWIVIMMLFGNICRSLLSANFEGVGDTNRSVKDHHSAARKIQNKIKARETKQKSKSHILKVSLFVSEDSIISICHDNDIPAEIVDMKHILAFLAKDRQKEDFLSTWETRNKVALKLLEYWRQHPEEISDIPPALIFSEKAKETTDRKLYSILSENENTLKQYIETPLGEINKLYFFLIDTAVYPKSAGKGEK